MVICRKPTLPTEVLGAKHSEPILKEISKKKGFQSEQTNKQKMYLNSTPKILSSFYHLSLPLITFIVNTRLLTV